MNSSTILPSKLSTKSSSVLSTREYLIRTKVKHGSISDHKKVLSLRIFDEANRTSEEIVLKNPERNDSSSSSSKKKNIDSFHIQTERKLGETIQKLKLHASNISNSRSDNDENERIFLKWIDLTDLNTKRAFCFPVDDYLPSSAGDALELTEVHQDTLCDEEDHHIQTIDRLKSNPAKKRPSTTEDSSAAKPASKDNRSNDAKLYDVRTKTGQQGFLGLNSAIKANVYLKLYDTNRQASESIPLTQSTLHRRPFRSHQTDQFEIGTKTKLALLKKVLIWHDGEKDTRLHCDTLEITDRSNGQIYCFQIKGASLISYIVNDLSIEEFL